MDVNNTRYFLLRSDKEFQQAASALQWNPTLKALTLAQDQQLRLPASDPTAALAAWAASTPLALDGFDQVGRLSGDRTRAQFNAGRGFQTLRDGELAEVAAPVGAFTDLTLGGDGRLALPYTNGSQHGLIVFHLARRWQARCDLDQAPDGTALPPPRRAAVDGDNQIWLVTAGHLLLCRGEPLPLPYTPQPARFEPDPVNPRGLELRRVQALPAGWQALAVACDEQSVYVLVHDGGGHQAVLSRLRDDRIAHPLALHPCDPDVPFVIDLALAADSSYPVPGRLAALAPREAGDQAFARRDCTILELRGDAQAGNARAALVRERYPMQSLAVPRFVSSADGQLRYQAEADPDFPQVSPRPRELHALRRPRFHGSATAALDQVFDSGQPETDWHRLYLDASIPPGCAIEIRARVFATPGAQAAAPFIPQPAPLWNPLPSELPLATSLAPYQSGHGGLFEILLQRPDGPVRRLSGRYLQLEVTLRGNGRQTPCLYAIRVYNPRFSYQEAYLPELFRQEQRFDPTHAVGPANGADVRERLLGAFEGMLTPLEGRVAAADRLLHPDATPPAHLGWLAEALGARLPRHWPIARQRRLVREVGLIQQHCGTLPATNLALDIVTDGGVQRGQVVLVENFRLRRTMATILGISMDDADHPLTLGTGMSGNSIVGESLILSESDARTFLGLFSPDLATADEAAAVKRFFEEYAHQLTVLLHGRAAAQRKVVEETLTALLPAHLAWTLLETTHPFVLGLSPLLAVDTFLETQPAARRVRLDDTFLGREGVIVNPAAFSPADINVQRS